MRPEIVVFDLGKVLVDFDYNIAIGKLAPRTHCTAAEVHQMFFVDDLLFRYEVGEIGTTAFFVEFQKRTGFAGTLGEFAETFGGIFTEIPGMVAFHRRMREQQVPTYILSNTNELAVNWIRQAFQFFRQFDGYVYSFEYKAMKPQPRIYEALEHLSRRKGGEILYFDDRPENVEAAIQRGWHGVVHQDPKQSVTVATNLGL